MSSWDLIVLQSICDVYAHQVLRIYHISARLSIKMRYSLGSVVDDVEMRLGKRLSEVEGEVDNRIST